MFILKVLVEHPSYKLDDTFDYLSYQDVQAGCRVKIKFGHQHIVGYVESSSYTNQTKEQLEEQHGFRYSYIEDIIDNHPLLNDELKQLSKYVAKQTLSPQISVLQAMLPPSLKPNSSKSVGKLYRKIVVFKQDIQVKTKKQTEALQYIKDHDRLPLNNHPCSNALINALKKQGAIEVIEEEIYRIPDTSIKQDQKRILTLDQQNVVDQIKQGFFKPETYLLHGVTGAGKTEVYLQLSEEVISKGKTVLMLVPEIALTPMMVDAFKGRFLDTVAIIHSRLTQGQRYDEYRRIVEGKVKIVVGARSAIFAPLENIGLIIMDEEHDASYKQESTPRYHTTQVARYRGKYHSCPVVLGSATPSLESYSRALKGIYKLCTLDKRVNTRPLPHIDIVDMAEEVRKKNYGILSRKLESEIQQRLDANEQVMLLLNKRGYASFQRCNDCKEVITCPHCDVTLTYHKDSQTMKCHYCSYSQPVKYQCPKCRSSNVKMIGTGTQKIEEYLQSRFLNARVLRYDVDTTRKKDGHRNLLKQFENQEANILVGTQMIAKGLDFENVTLVGVINADLSLNIPDFRANERTFQLLEQVSGRSGRGKKQGSVVIQTYNPHHFVIECVCKHDYLSFYKEEMKSRQLAFYPPFSHLISILIQSKDENYLKHCTNQIKDYLTNKLTCKILGPTDCTIYKMNDIYRKRITLKVTDTSNLYDVISTMNDYYNKNDRKVTVVCDFNPYTTL